jgi:hypothetical protein
LIADISRGVEIEGEYHLEGWRDISVRKEEGDENYQE